MALWRATHPDSHVTVTELAHDIKVATKFLGVDMNTQRLVGSVDRPPHVFETLVFTDYGEAMGYWRRYANWAGAEIGHNKTVEAVKTRLGGAATDAGRGSQRCMARGAPGVRSQRWARAGRPLG